MLPMLFLCLVFGAFAALPHKFSDPAMSWLAYGVAESASEIEFFSTTTVVPFSLPVLNGGKPAFWMGLAPADGLYLAQPINTKKLDGGYFAFVETYDWQSGYDYQSNKLLVQPGSKVYAEVSKQSAGVFRMAVRVSGGVWVNATVTVPSYVAPFVMAYVVLEHQPSSCSMLPSDELFLFSDLVVRPVPVSPWSAHTCDPACASVAAVVASGAVAISWNSSAAASTRKQAAKMCVH